MFFESSERKKHTQLGVVAHMNLDKQAGTWRIPNEDQTKQALKALREFQEQFFSTVGDDEFWDHINQARDRVYNLGQESVRREMDNNASKREAGTWALTNNPKKYDEMLADLQAFQNKWWNIIGDDELYDKVYNVEQVIRKLKAYILKNKEQNGV